MRLALLLISFTTSSILQGCCGDTIINVVNGVYSTKAESKAKVFICQVLLPSSPLVNY